MKSLKAQTVLHPLAGAPQGARTRIRHASSLQALVIGVSLCFIAGLICFASPRPRLAVHLHSLGIWGTEFTCTPRQYFHELTVLHRLVSLPRLATAAQGTQSRTRCRTQSRSPQTSAKPAHAIRRRKALAPSEKIFVARALQSVSRALELANSNLQHAANRLSSTPEQLVTHRNALMYWGPSQFTHANNRNFQRTGSSHGARRSRTPHAGSARS